jgi:pimeloyl-ACP methyl ester carboxylesterase
MDSVPTEHTVDSRFPLRTVEADGRHFSFRESGSGPAMVLLHGIGSGSGSWLSQLDELSSTYRVIAWDAPGYGATTPVDNPSPVAAEYAAVLEFLLAALKIEPAVLIGHSFGALTAGSYASTHSELPTLIVADPANGYGKAGPETRAQKLNPRLKAIRELGPRGLAEKRSSALANSHLTGDAPAYHGPVLVMCGSEDTVTPEAVCRPVADAYPNAKYQTLPGVGHASYVENGPQFNAAVLEFITGQHG